MHYFFSPYTNLTDYIHWQDGVSYPVAQLKPNPWGLYDTLGNGWEMTADWEHPPEPNFAQVTDPKGPATGTARIILGGCHRFGSLTCSFTDQARVDPAVDVPMVGFRLVRTKK